MSGEIAIPANPAQRGAYQRGYEARLRGVSRYSNPYTRERRVAGRLLGLLGWRATFAAAWWAGWVAADEAVPPAPHVNVDDDYPEEGSG